MYTRNRTIPLELRYRLKENMILEFKQIQYPEYNKDTIRLNNHEGLEVYNMMEEGINRFIDEANKRFDNPRFLKFLRKVEDFAEGKYAYNKYKETVNFILNEDYVISFHTLDINRVRLYNTTTNKIITNRIKILELFPDISMYREVMRKMYGDYSNYKFEKKGAVLLVRVNNDDEEDIEIIPMIGERKIKYKDFMSIMREIERIRMEDEGKGNLTVLDNVEVSDLSAEYDTSKFKNINREELMFKQTDINELRVPKTKKINKPKEVEKSLDVNIPEPALVPPYSVRDKEDTIVDTQSKSTSLRERLGLSN